MPNRRDVMSGAAAAALALPQIARAQAPAIAEPVLIALEPKAGRIRAQIAPGAGGELAGLQCLVGGRAVELLYRGRDYSPSKGWRGKAPVLFPAVGRNAVAAGGLALSDPAAAGWLLGERKYPMPMHGFVKDGPWTVEHSASGEREASALVSTRDSDKTRPMYPFGFELGIEYRVAGSSVILAHRVVAAKGNREPMPFSIGNHMTFNLPFAPGGSIERTSLTSSARRQVLVGAPQNLPTGQVVDADFARPRPIASLGGQVSTSIAGCPAGQVWTRLEDPAGMAITVSHRADWLPEGEPVLFNLWSDMEQGFFAPEPWVGKQYSLARRDGVVLLPPGETFNWQVAVDVTLFGPLAARG